MAGKGGAMPGGGRPKGSPNKGRAEFLRLVHEIGKPKELIEKLKELTLGVMVAQKDGDGGAAIYSKPPDREAITYLLDQAYGKAKQSVDVGIGARTLEDELDGLPE